MKAIVIPERPFLEAFKQAEYDVNMAVHSADDRAESTPARVAVALANLQAALHRLRDRLIETQL